MSVDPTLSKPAVRELPLLGVLPQLVADPMGLTIDLMRESDELVPRRVGPKTIWFVHHPDHLKHIMLDNHRNYVKGPLFARADILVGKGLVVSEGAEWARQRRLMAPPFAPKRLRSIVPLLGEVAAERLGRWGAGGTFEMWHEMSGITMSALLKTIFATSMDDETVERFVAAFDTVVAHVGIRAAMYFLPEWFPLPGRRAALAGRDELHRIIEGIIADRRRSGVDGNDLLGLLLAARDEQGSGMTDTALRDEIKTAVFAGYDSTATGIAFTLYLLATHPESARRARAEILEVMPEGLPDAGQIERLVYLERVFKEALRLYPPLAFHPRMALEEDVIGHTKIPAGATLIYSNSAPGRNPAYWEHPDAFYPDHFLPEAVAKRHKFAYQPFAAGPRVCIGMAMAILEAKIVLALALRDYDLVRPVNTPIAQGRLGTTRAKGGIWIEVQPRGRPLRGRAS